MNPEHIAWTNRWKITAAIIGVPLLIVIALMIADSVYEYLVS
jgi:hypothetical protein